MKLSRARFLQATSLLLFGCGADSDDLTSRPEASGPAQEPSSPAQPESSSGGQSGGPSVPEPSPGSCGARAEAENFVAFDDPDPMTLRLPNHAEPHRFVISEEQLRAVLMLGGQDEAGAWPTLRFETSAGSGETPGTPVGATTSHVHPVSLNRKHAEELMAGNIVEAFTVPAADEGGIVHGHVLQLSRCE